jgi:hypothetical protein
MDFSRPDIEHMSRIYGTLSSKTVDDEVGYFCSGAEIEVLESILDGKRLSEPVERARRSQVNEKPDIPDEVLNKDFAEPPELDEILQDMAENSLIRDNYGDKPSKKDLTSRGTAALDRSQRHMDELELSPGKLSSRYHFFSDPDDLEMFLNYVDEDYSADHGSLEVDAAGRAEISEGSDSSQELALMKNRKDRAGINSEEEEIYWAESLKLDYERISGAAQ